MATERSVMVRLRANADQFNREMMKARAAVSGVRDEIDTTNDRTAWLAQGFLALAPALVPLGAAAVPVLAGIATQATVGAGAIGTMVLAFHGVGDALKALNTYQLAPTSENLEKLHIAMRKLGPEGADFVRFLDDAGAKLSVLGMDARAEMFPGMTEGIENALRLLPQLRKIVQEIASGIGDLSIDAGKGIAGPEFREFFNYLQDEAKPLLVEMGHTVGNFIAGFAHMMTAFGGLTTDFSGGLLEMSRDFKVWADGLEQSTSFQDFVQYIRESGPQALELIGSVAEAFVQLVEAAAPIGSVALPVLTKFFDILAAIADTPVGSLLILTAALTSMYGRVKALQTITTGGVMGSMTKGFRDSGKAAKAAVPSLVEWRRALFSAARSQKQLEANMRSGIPAYAISSAKASIAKTKVAEFAKAAAPAAGAAGLLALSMSGVAESAGFGNTAMGATVGLMATGGPWGAAIGTAIGLLIDAKAAQDNWTTSIEKANRAIRTDDIPLMRQQIKQLKEDLQFRASDTDFSSLGNIFKNIKSDIADTFSGDFLGTEHMDKDWQTLNDLGNELIFIRGLNGKGWDTSGLELFYEGLGYTADEAHRAAMGVDEFTRATERAMGILDRQAAFDAFQASIDAATKSIKENGKTLDNHTEKGRNNREALRNIASTALKAADGLKGLQRNNYIEGAADRFVEFAKKMGMSEDAAKRLAARLFDLDKLKPKPKIDVEDRKARAKVKRILDDLGYLDHSTGNPQADLLIQQFLKGKLTVEQMMKVLNGLKAKPHVDADTDQAVAKIHGVISLLSSVHDKTVHINTVFSRNNLAPPGSGIADGGTVPGPRQPYGDKVLAYLAPGEEVITNRHGEADRYRADRAAGRIPAYADGGTVTYRGNSDDTQTRAGDTPAERESRRTAAALKKLRAELKHATDALEKEKKQRDALVDKMKSLTTDVSGGLRSDLFAESDVWSSQYGGSSPAGVMSTLRGDNRDARAMLAAIRELKAKGLHGPALAEVLRTGGLAGAQAFADLTRGELREYAELYNTRSRLTRAAGEAAGGAAYGAALRAERREYRELKQEVVKLRHAVERNGKHDREDHKANRDSQRRGASNAGRNRRRD